MRQKRGLIYFAGWNHSWAKTTKAYQSPKILPLLQLLRDWC